MKQCTRASFATFALVFVRKWALVRRYFRIQLKYWANTLHVCTFLYVYVRNVYGNSRLRMKRWFRMPYASVFRRSFCFFNHSKQPLDGYAFSLLRVCMHILMRQTHTHIHINIPRDATINREYKAYIGMGATNINNDVFVLLHFLLCMMNTISQNWEKKSYRYAFGTVLWCTVDICFICALLHTYIIRMYIQTTCTYRQLFILREQT